jgi:hypothetical protein
MGVGGFDNPGRETWLVRRFCFYRDHDQRRRDAGPLADGCAPLALNRLIKN